MNSFFSFGFKIIWIETYSIGVISVWRALKYHSSLKYHSFLPISPHPLSSLNNYKMWTWMNELPKSKHFSQISSYFTKQYTTRQMRPKWVFIFSVYILNMLLLKYFLTLSRLGYLLFCTVLYCPVLNCTVLFLTGLQICCTYYKKLLWIFLDIFCEHFTAFTKKM